jgi:hypothetical protein
VSAIYCTTIIDFIFYTPNPNNIENFPTTNGHIKNITCTSNGRFKLTFTVNKKIFYYSNIKSREECIALQKKFENQEALIWYRPKTLIKRLLHIIFLEKKPYHHTPIKASITPKKNTIELKNLNSLKKSYSIRKKFAFIFGVTILALTLIKINRE